MSVLCRLSAGVLLLQTGLPVATTIKTDVEARQAREAVLGHAMAKAALPPPPMKGVPLMKVGTAAPPAPVAPAGPSPLVPGRTLLDSEAYLRREIGAVEASAWRTELAKGAIAARKARLLVQFGEVALGHHEPAQAKALFDRAASLLPETSPDRGLARFDAALCLFLQGRFKGAKLAFRHVAASPLAGVDRRLATLYARHAAACEGYHAERGAAGIPEPETLDPLCGVAALATCLRGIGMPHAKKDLLAKVGHNGEGSSMSELVAALPSLGLMGRQVSADERGLRALPKPLVAHVERDHYVTVVEADAKGMEYVCSDCGAWPGGPVRLSWKQWRMMEVDRYLAVARPGTPAAVALENLPASKAQGPGRVAVASTGPHNAGFVLAAERILAAVGTAALAQTWPIQDPFAPVCGMRGVSPQCNGSTDVPTHGSPAKSAYGTNDPVNLATGEEEYAAPEALSVYNPTGPSLSWRHEYHSLANVTPNGFGMGWTHPYNYRIEVVAGRTPREETQTQSVGGGTTGGGSTGGGTSDIGHPYNPVAPPSRSTALVLPNSARITFVESSTAPTASAPVQRATVQPGIPMLVDACYDAATGTKYYLVTFEDRSKWSFRPSPVNASFFYPTRIADRVGNWIGLNWATFNYRMLDTATVGHAALGLTSIVDSNNQALLTIGYNADAQTVSASDRYGRSVYYTVGLFNSEGTAPNVPPQVNDELTQVSQVVATGTGNPPVRFQYGYANYNNSEPSAPTYKIPFLHTISVPSPTGTGMSTATIDYTSIGEVKQTTDANGNVTLYSPAMVGTTPQPNSGRVQIKDPQGNLVYQVDEYFDGRMSRTKTMNGAGQTVAIYAHADPNTPYGVSSVTDGNGRVWSATHDVLGHTLTSTTPKGTTKTYLYTYTLFALGERTSVQEGTKTATTYVYYEPSGLTKEVSSPIPGLTGSSLTQTTYYTYSALGNITQVSAPGNNAATFRSTYFGYTTDGGYSQSEALHKPITITDALGKVTHLRYDARRNVIQSTDPNGNSSATT